MSGWRDILGSVFAAHRARLLRIVRRHGGDLDQAPDLVQDAFLKVLAAGSTGSTAGDMRFLYAVARNAALDHRKSASRRSHAILVPTQIAQEVSSPYAELEGRDALRAIDAALARLPTRTREVFLLRRVDGLSHAEISERLGMARSTVEKHLLRAIRSCEAALAEDKAS